MKKLSTLCVAVASIFTANALERNADMGTLAPEESFIPSPLTLTPQSSPFFMERARERIVDQADTRIVYRLIFDTHFSVALRSPEETLARRGVSAVGDGVKYALREHMLDTALYDFVDDRLLRLGGSFSGFLRDILSGDEWRKHTPSPSEIQFLDDRDRYTGFQKGIRPFRDDPYAFVSYGWHDTERVLRMENSLRFIFEQWQAPAVGFFTEIPLRKWHLGIGLEKRVSDDESHDVERNGQLFSSTNRTLRATIGLRGTFLRGFAYIGGDLIAGQAFALWRFRY